MSTAVGLAAAAAATVAVAVAAAAAAVSLADATAAMVCRRSGQLFLVLLHQNRPLRREAGELRVGRIDRGVVAVLEVLGLRDVLLADPQLLLGLAGFPEPRHGRGGLGDRVL